MGSKAIHFFTIVVFLMRYLVQAEVHETCRAEESRKQRVSVNLDTREDDDGHWVTSFTALKNSSSLTKTLKLEVGHEIYDCGGQQIVRVRGFVKDAFKSVISVVTNVTNDGLFFDKRASPSAIIKNNGRTIEKKGPVCCPAALTNRALKDDELLEVVVDRRGGNEDHAMGIGVTVNSPSSITLPDHMNVLKNGTWMLYFPSVFHDGGVLNNNYLESRLNVQVGERVGVMRKGSGVLHFYVNGVDKGPAASNIPMQVYGAVELWGAALEASIVRPV